MNRILLILACLNLTISYSQTNKKNQDDTKSKDYMKIVFDQCAKPDIIEVQTNPDGYIEIGYLCEGKRFEIGIKNNKLLFKEHAVSNEEIPFEIINRKIEKKYQGWTLDEVSQVMANDTTFLKVEIIKDGIEQNLYFTNDGAWFKIKSFDSTTTFDFNEIEKNTIYKSAKFKFENPDISYEMPELLKEVSGITIGSQDVIYCIQDELGAIFEYNIKEQKISNFYRFTDIGDFEDLAIHKEVIYILRSDGNLFEYDLKNKSKTRQTMLQINSLNMEGLCFNDGYLYIACKAASINQSETKRMVYRANTDTLENIEPYLEINILDLSSFLTKHYPELEVTSFTFNPSAVAIHPLSKEMYILSAENRFIAVYRDKQLINIIPLSPDVYYKPEGLAFYQNGDLLISSEGDKKGFVKGTINLLKHQ